MDKCVDMSMCNLVETVHNKWLQQSGNEMTSLYEATMDNLIHKFMQITNYKSWLKVGSTGKDHDSVPFKLKVVATCGHLMLLANAIKSYLKAKDLNTTDCVLKRFELFGSTKRNFYLPLDVDCNSH